MHLKPGPPSQIVPSSNSIADPPPAQHPYGLSGLFCEEGGNLLDKCLRLLDLGMVPGGLDQRQASQGLARAIMVKKDACV